MNVLLTGATGFLGSHLALALVAEGHRVIVLKRASSRMQRLEQVRSELVCYDLEGLDFSRPFTEQGHVDAVIHAATCYGRHQETSATLVESNLLFPLRLLEAAIFFKTDTFFNTDTVLDPHLNAYALSKKHFTDWGRQLAAPDRIRFVNIRLEHFYGPGDDSSKFTTWIVESCARNLPDIKLTAGEQQRDFIHIADTVAAYVCLLAQADQLGPGFQEVNLGSGETVRVRDFVEMVHRLTASTSQLHFGSLPYRDHEQMESLADTSRLSSIGWRCRISLQDGIASLIEEKRC